MGTGKWFRGRDCRLEKQFLDDLRGFCFHAAIVATLKLLRTLHPFDVDELKTVLIDTPGCDDTYGVPVPVQWRCIARDCLRACLDGGRSSSKARR